MAAAAHKGVWDAFERERGPGAWLDDDGELMLHCGDGVWRSRVADGPGAGAWLAPGEHGRYVYPASSPRPKPYAGAADDGREAGDLFPWR